MTNFKLGETIYWNGKGVPPASGDKPYLGKYYIPQYVTIIGVLEDNKYLITFGHEGKIISSIVSGNFLERVSK